MLELLISNSCIDIFVPPVQTRLFETKSADGRCIFISSLSVAAELGVASISAFPPTDILSVKDEVLIEIFCKVLSDKLVTYIMESSCGSISI